MSEFLQVAKWVAQSSPALLVGSVALRALHGGTRAPNDVDFLAPMSSLSPIAAALVKRGYAWKSWERAEEPPFDEAGLTGRIYLRGTHPSLPTVDLTYEPPLLWSEAWARRRLFEGIHVAAAEDLATIMEARGTVRDQMWCTRLRSSPM